MLWVSSEEKIEERTRGIEMLDIYSAAGVGGRPIQPHAEQCGPGSPVLRGPPSQKCRQKADAVSIGGGYCSSEDAKG